MSSTFSALLVMRAAVLSVLFMSTALTSPLGELDTDNHDKLKPNHTDSDHDKLKPNHTDSDHDKLKPNHTDSDLDKLKPNHTDSHHDKLKPNHTDSDLDKLKPNHTDSDLDKLKPNHTDSDHDKLKPNHTDSDHDKLKPNHTDSDHDKLKPNHTDSDLDKLKPNHTDSDHDKLKPNHTDSDHDELKPNHTDSDLNKLKPNHTDSDHDELKPNHTDSDHDKLKPNHTESDLHKLKPNHTDSDHNKLSWAQHFTTKRNNSNTTRRPTEKINDTHSEGLRDFESVHFTDDDFNRCFKETGRLDPVTLHKCQGDALCALTNQGQAVHREMFATQGEMTAEFSQSSLEGFFLQPGDLLYCVVKLRVPRGQVVALFMDETVADSEQFNIIADDSVTSVLVNSVARGDGKDTTLPIQRDQLVYSSADRLFLYFYLVSGKLLFGAQMSFKLRFEAVPPLTRFAYVHYESPGKGFVQTPFFDGFTNHVMPFRLPWTNITIPPDHVIMVSFPFGELTGMLNLKTDTLNTRFTCLAEYPKAAVHNTSSLAVAFDSGCGTNPGDEEQTFGFRMNFSFHHVTAKPEQLSDGTWNCSVPHWPDFRHHVLCNLQRECGGGEDEVACPYYTPRCGAGFITAGRACLLYKGKLGWRKMSWFHASDLCVERGCRLATLKTEEALETALSLIPVNRFKSYVFFIGVFRATSVLGLWYRNAVQWTDGTVVHKGAWVPGSPRVLDDDTSGHIGQPSHCGHYNQRQKTRFALCGVPFSAAAICEKVPSAGDPDDGFEVLSLPRLGNITLSISPVTCPKGHVTHEFLACDVKSECWSRDETTACAAPLSPLPPAYTCRNLIGGVPYTLVCDHRADCSDNSDEDFCVFPPCSPGSFSCGNSECISRRRVCDGSGNCYSASNVDEQACSMARLATWSDDFTMRPPPPLALHVINGFFEAERMPAGRDGVKVCPETHVRCADNGNCLPLYLRCNGVFDCLHHEDEAGCDSSTCPGFYRCRGSAVCLHPSSLCDGYPQCPQHDDELLCDVSCPAHCVCLGLALYCGHSFAVEKYDGLRYLDATGSGLTPSDVKGSPLLIFLSLAECGLTSLDGLALPNLLDLDLSRNQLTSLSTLMLAGVRQVRKVVLSGNVLLRVLDSGQGRHDRLAELDLSGVLTPRLDASLLTHFPGLKHLNLSGSQVERVADDGFVQLTELRVVDLRGCPVSHVPPVMFQGLGSLQAVYADSFRLCCPALLPADFNVHDCHAPLEEVSSCDDLLGSEAYSAVTFVVALVAIIGNGSSFVFRVFLSKSKSKLGFGVFVTHLSLSDFLMGVYLVFLGVADRAYKGRYLWNDVWWRNSSACKVAGFLSLLSSEVSTFIMCLITLDRFLVLRFPFSRVHFALKSAHLASCVAWLAGVILATVPLLPVTSHWRFYGHTSICVPLPLTRKDFAGRVYSFSIVIVLNFVLFLFVCCGQLVIYWSVQANAMSAAATSSTRRTQDLTIARRLLAVAMSDFLCWFPIGLLGLLASRGVPIPGEVNVAVAVLVLPLNSALNPFLYTVNVLLERRRLAREERLRKLILSQLSARSK